MKTFLKILLLFGLTFFMLWDTSFSNYAIPWSDINNVSINDSSSWDIQNDLNRLWSSLLLKAKVVVQWLLIIFIVYAGIQMIISMWSDEEKLSSSKRQIRYVLIAIIFINVPWAIFDAFRPENHGIVDWEPNPNNFVAEPTGDSIFINDVMFGDLFDDKIIGFVKVLLFILAIIMIIMAGIKIMTARWRDDHVKDGKTKIIYSILALIFAWIMEAWKYIAFNWDVTGWLDLFGTLANLALFFAWPTAIFFLTLAGYYYITANGEEEKVKKAKSIVINTVLATIILLASYTFLLDLANL